MTVIVRTTLVAIMLLIQVPTCWAQRIIREDATEFFRVVFSPDGKIFASLSQTDFNSPKLRAKREVKLWSYRCKVIETVASDSWKFGSSGGARNLKDIAFAPNGKTLAIADQHGVTLRDISTGKEDDPINGEEKGALAVAFSPDGAVLAWRSQATVTVWNLQERKAIAVVKARKLFSDASMPSSRHGLTFTSDGGKLSWSEPKEVIIWDVKNRNKVSIKTETNFPLPPAFSPKSDILAWRDGIDNSKIVLYDVKTAKVIDNLEVMFRGGPPVFSWDGKRLATGGRVVPVEKGTAHPPHSIVIFDVASGVPIRTLSTPLGDSDSFAFSPQGDFFAICNYNLVMLFYVRPGE